MKHGDVDQAVTAELHGGEVATADVAIDHAFFEAGELCETLEGHEGHMGRDLGRFVLFHVVTCLWLPVVGFGRDEEVVCTLIVGTTIMVYTITIV